MSYNVQRLTLKKKPQPLNRRDIIKLHFIQRELKEFKKECKNQYHELEIENGKLTTMQVFQLNVQL